MQTSQVRITVNGCVIDTEPTRSILEAMIDAGETLIDGVGCMGQGVCGSCRVLVRRQGESEVLSALACETRACEGLQVAFLDHLPMHRHHVYAMDDWNGDSWRILERINATFPEAQHCRHCGGCDSACPKHLQVHKGVMLAAAGDLSAAECFDECIMCDLCTIACPELISPNHLGLYVRRLSTAIGFRPADLVLRLHQIERGEMVIDQDVASTQP
ncbi:ferredoxin [Halotalea alkalilenta]|uniref:ferredoxin n=1 Tax=Halotalea alkalilenta TaxID=376489 RepID=UPI000481B53C|nr:ferredoxin [Halotalea alkalilenta]